MNKFGFISNYNISRTQMWKDGKYLEDLGTNILAGNFVDFLNKVSFQTWSNGLMAKALDS